MRQFVILALLAVGVLAAVAAPGAVFAVPANDDFAQALVIPASLPYSNSQSTVDATLENGEPDPCGIGATVWYSFTPSQSGTVKVTAVSSDVDSVLAVYTGASLPGLSLIECNDDTGAAGPSAVQFTATSGTTYRIQAGGLAGASGELTIDLKFGIAPGNDSFASAAAAAPPLPYSDSRDTTVATLEENEPQPSCAPVGRTVWYNFTPAQTGTYEFNTAGSGFDTVLAVFSGAGLDTLVEVACNDDGPVDLSSQVSLVAAAGQSLRVQIGGYQGDSGALQVLVQGMLDLTDIDGDGYGGSVEDYIGTVSADPCGFDGWPSNVVDSSPSDNKLDIQDVISFIAPERLLDTNPGPGSNYLARWDLAPGPNTPFPNHISIFDITTLLTGVQGSPAYPPMFGGQRAFGRTCPFPP